MSSMILVDIDSTALRICRACGVFT